MPLEAGYICNIMRIKKLKRGRRHYFQQKTRRLRAAMPRPAEAPDIVNI